ncbi:MAG: hypothetical protein U5J98_10550 [Halobacteriales archaeon]|nr:hypothetical protein [Halobacteriales archaeon]
MGERVASDHPSVRTFRGHIEPSGATSRPRVALPAEAADAMPDGVVRLVLDGRTYHADVRAGSDGPVIRGAYDNARLARSPGEGENRLPGWIEAADLSIGRSVLIDEVVDGSLFGARAPGRTAVYEATEPPASSLSSIAEGLDE